LQTFLSLLQ